MNKFYKFLGVGILLLAGCTDNQRARNFGGTENVILPRGKKLVNVTWKQSQLWYLIRDSREGEKPERFEFLEKSSFGIIEGKVVFEEQ